MKVIEILNFNRELLTRLLESGIRLEDVRYVNLYTDYFHLLRAGEKMTYIGRYLQNGTVYPSARSTD